MSSTKTLKQPKGNLPGQELYFAPIVDLLQVHKMKPLLLQEKWNTNRLDS